MDNMEVVSVWRSSAGSHLKIPGGPDQTSRHFFKIPGGLDWTSSSLIHYHVFNYRKVTQPY